MNQEQEQELKPETSPYKCPTCKVSHEKWVWKGIQFFPKGDADIWDCGNCGSTAAIYRPVESGN